VLAVLAAMAVFGSLPLVFVTAKAAARMKKFENQLPDLLITMAASLKAGHSFRQGIQAVVDEGAEPAAKEFRRVMTETQLGKPMDDALADMAERVGSKNLSFVITSVTIQRQIGGSLAGLFDMVADTVRQRQQFFRKVKGLTAMGRMSAYVLVGLPIFCPRDDDEPLLYGAAVPQLCRPQAHRHRLRDAARRQPAAEKNHFLQGVNRCCCSSHFYSSAARPSCSARSFRTRRV
jgi:hypothetical protein